jgi:alpha-L-fucosidase
MGGSQRNWNSSQIFQWSSSVSSPAPLLSIKLQEPATSVNRVHVFALSMTESACSRCNITTPTVSIRRVRFTTKWEVVKGMRAQVVEVTLANLTPQSSFSRSTSIASRHEIEVIGTGLTTVIPGVIHRLVASDQVRTNVLVSVSQTSGNATVRVVDSFGNIFSDTAGWPIHSLPEIWTPDAEVLGTHETPTWVGCNDALFHSSEA